MVHGLMLCPRKAAVMWLLAMRTGWRNKHMEKKVKCRRGTHFHWWEGKREEWTSLMINKYQKIIGFCTIPPHFWNVSPQGRNLAEFIVHTWDPKFLYQKIVGFCTIPPHFWNVSPQGRNLAEFIVHTWDPKFLWSFHNGSKFFFLINLFIYLF